tara:strand:- start:11512 stop:12123 length:612 start_codon:yes stop_codon:yes gene_type:complete
MALSLEPSQLIQFFTAMSPLLLAFLLVVVSLFNQDVKGLVYLGGVLLGSFAWLIMLFLIKSPTNPDRADSCNMINWPFNITAYNNPNYSSYFIAFTIAYLVLPMYFNEQMNWTVLVFLLTLFVADAYSSVSKKCTPVSGPVIGSIIGLLMGGMWFTVFHATGNDDLLYFQEMLSNNVVCKRPEKQTFKCSVYRKGELISSSII